MDTLTPGEITQYRERAHKEIRIESWSNAARVLLIRGFADGGPFAEQHTTNADRSRAVEDFDLHGFPEGVQVSPLVASVRRGECYVRITLMMDGEPVQRLSAGYLTDSRTLNWPPGIFEGFTDGPGLPRTITGTNPAAGAEITEAVPTNARWRVKSILLIFETDGTVATRKVVLKFNDGVNDFVVLGPGGDQTQTASISGFRYEWIEGIGLEHAERTNVGSMMGLPPDLILFQGWSFLTDTINGVAGDDYAAPIFAVEEWIEE